MKTFLFHATAFCYLHSYRCLTFVLLRCTLRTTKPQTIRRVVPCSTNSYLVRLCVHSVCLCFLRHISRCAVSQNIPQFYTHLGETYSALRLFLVSYVALGRPRRESFAVWYGAVPNVELVSHVRVTSGAAPTEQAEISQNSPVPAGRRNRPIQSSTFAVHERRFVNKSEFKFSIFTPVSQGSGLFPSSLVGPRVLFPRFHNFLLLSHAMKDNRVCLLVKGGSNALAIFLYFENTFKYGSALEISETFLKRMRLQCLETKCLESKSCHSVTLKMSSLVNSTHP